MSPFKLPELISNLPPKTSNQARPLIVPWSIKNKINQCTYQTVVINSYSLIRINNCNIKFDYYSN